MQRIALYLFMLLYVSTSLNGEEEASTKGKLIVTYQTGPKRERLDRVRFRLTNANQEAQMYPKENGFVEDHELLSRMVVFENLPEGDYELEFVIPNADGFFEEIPSKSITIKPNSVVKVDQAIKPRYSPHQDEKKQGTLLISYETLNLQNRHLLHNIRFRLTDDQGKQTIYPQTKEAIVDNLSNGNIFYLNLPVGTYLVEFFLEGKEGEMQSVPMEKVRIEPDRMTMLEKTFNLI